APCGGPCSHRLRLRRRQACAGRACQTSGSGRGGARRRKTLGAQASAFFFRGRGFVGGVTSPLAGEVGAEGAGWGRRLFTSPLAGEVGAEGAGWGRRLFTSPLAGEVGAEGAGWGRRLSA